MYIKVCSIEFDHTVKPIFKGSLTRGHPVITGRIFRTMSYLPHVKEPVMKGHLSCRDTFSGI